MKKTIITEASTMSQLDKMYQCEHGQRRQNWRSCSLDKLKENYRICLYQNFTKAGGEAEAEIIHREMWGLLAPRPFNIDNFSTNHAQFVWDNRKTYHRIMQAASECPITCGDTLRPSEYLTRAFILALAMDNPELDAFINAVKATMRAQETYSGLMPKYLNDIANRPGVADAVAVAVAGVDYLKTV